jgi:hypothetical protein
MDVTFNDDMITRLQGTVPYLEGIFMLKPYLNSLRQYESWIEKTTPN